jgi:hypothetical protein
VLAAAAATDTIQQQVQAARVAAAPATAVLDQQFKYLVEELAAVLTVQPTQAVVPAVHKIQVTVPIV